MNDKAMEIEKNKVRRPKRPLKIFCKYMMLSFPITGPAYNLLIIDQKD